MLNDLAKAIRRWTEKKEKAHHETRLASARQNLWRITKHLKTIQDGQEPDTPQASPIVDVEMEIID